MKYKLFARKMCPNCPPVKEYCAAHFEGEIVDCDSEAGLEAARAFGVSSTPTAIFFDDSGEETGRAHSVEEIKDLIKLE